MSNIYICDSLWFLKMFANVYFMVNQQINSARTMPSWLKLEAIIDINGGHSQSVLAFRSLEDILGMRLKLKPVNDSLFFKSLQNHGVKKSNNRDVLSFGRCTDGKKSLPFVCRYSSIHFLILSFPQPVNEWVSELEYSFSAAEGMIS